MCETGFSIEYFFYSQESYIKRNVLQIKGLITTDKWQTNLLWIKMNNTYINVTLILRNKKKYLDIQKVKY